MKKCENCEYHTVLNTQIQNLKSKTDYNKKEKYCYCIRYVKKVIVPSNHHCKYYKSVK